MPGSRSNRLLLPIRSGGWASLRSSSFMKRETGWSSVAWTPRRRSRINSVLGALSRQATSNSRSAANIARFAAPHQSAVLLFSGSKAGAVSLALCYYQAARLVDLGRTCAGWLGLRLAYLFVHLSAMASSPDGTASRPLAPFECGRRIRIWSTAGVGKSAGFALLRAE
jgi:hypothetical protein